MTHRRYRFGLMLQDFILAPNASFPELHLYKLYQSMAARSTAYEIWFIREDGAILSKDLSTVVGQYKDYNLDFIVYYGHLPTLDVFKVSLDWVSKNFLCGIEAQVFSLFPYLANASASMAGIQPYPNIHLIPKRLKELLGPTLSFHNHGQLTFFEPKPNFSNARLFYAASSQPLLRHKELIERLDQQEWVDFYGPEDQWRGVSNYRGSIPYDGGQALYQAINRSGICLAIHSPVHVHTDVYTTRVVEAVSAGAIMITDKMDVLSELCGPDAFTIDSTQPEEEVFNKIAEIVTWVRKNPSIARERAISLQNRFRNHFGSDDWFPGFCKAVDRQKQHYEEHLRVCNSGNGIDVLFAYQGKKREDLRAVIQQVERQTLLNKHLIVVCHPLLREMALEEASLTELDVTVITVETDNRRSNLNTSGHMLLRGLEVMKYSNFGFISSQIEWTRDHLARLLWEHESDDAKCALTYCHTHFVYQGRHVKDPIRLAKVMANGGADQIEEAIKSKAPQSIKQFLDSFNPISAWQLMGCTDAASFESPAYAQELSSFEAEVELRFPKGCQIYSKKLLETLSAHERSALQRLDGGEHIFLFLLLIINGQVEDTRFSQYSSCGLRIPSGDARPAGEASILRYALYPYAPLNHSIYRRGTGNVAFQLYDALIGLKPFWSTWVAHSQVTPKSNWVQDLPSKEQKALRRLIKLTVRITGVIPGPVKHLVLRLLGVIFPSGNMKTG